MKTLKEAMKKKKKKKKKNKCHKCVKKLNATEQIIGHCQYCNKCFCAVHVVPNHTDQYGHVCANYEHYLQKQQILLEQRNLQVRSKKIELI